MAIQFCNVTSEPVCTDLSVRGDGRGAASVERAHEGPLGHAGEQRPAVRQGGGRPQGLGVALAALHRQRALPHRVQAAAGLQQLEMQ